MTGRVRLTTVVAALVVMVVSVGTPAPVRAALIANDDSYSTPFETRLEVAKPGFLANDIGVVGKPTLVTGTNHGQLNWHDDGRIDYRPNDGFSGTDHFIYQLTLLLVRSTAKVTITVNAPTSTPTPSPTPTPKPTASPTPTPTPAPTPSPTPTPTPRPSLLPTLPPIPIPTLPPLLPTPSPTPTRPAGATEPPVTPSPSTSPGPSGSPDPSAAPSPDRSATPSLGAAGPVATSGPGPTNGAPAPTQALQFAGQPGTNINVTIGSIGGLGLPVEWLVPTLVVTGPGILLMLAVLAQGAGALLWLPYVRRTLGGDRRRRPTRQAAR